MDKPDAKLLPLPTKFLPGDEATLTRIDFDSASPLGQGSFGKVFKVKHKKTKKWYAIKVVSKPQIVNLKMVDQLTAEIQIMISLRHPCIIELHTYFEDGTNIFLVMELADGHLYAKLKKQSKFDEFTAARYMRDAASAVAHQHSRNPCIIHRDIKPENLLLCGDSQKIADFGWSSLNQGTRRTYCGTPDYLAPEMIKESGHTEKLDIWTLGILLYELLCGKAPFTPQGGKDRREKMRRLEVNILNMNLDFPPGFSSKGKKLVLKCLQKNPDQRISAEGILNDELISSFGLKPVREFEETRIGNNNDSRRYADKLDSRLANSRAVSREKADENSSLTQITKQRSNSRESPAENALNLYKLNTEGSDKWGPNRHFQQGTPPIAKNLYGVTSNELPPRRDQRPNHNNADNKSPTNIRQASPGIIKNSLLDQNSARGNSKDINLDMDMKYNKNFASTEQSWNSRVENVMNKIDTIRARTPTRIGQNSPLISKYTRTITETSPSSNTPYVDRYENKNKTLSDGNQIYQQKNYRENSPSYTSYLTSNTQNSTNTNLEKKNNYAENIKNAARSNSRSRANSGYLTGQEKLHGTNNLPTENSREYEKNYTQPPKSQIISTTDPSSYQNTPSSYINKNTNSYYNQDTSNIQNKQKNATIKSDKFLKTTNLANQNNFENKDQVYGLLLSERNVSNQYDVKTNSYYNNNATRHTADELGVDKNFSKTQNNFESQQIKANPKNFSDIPSVTSYSNNVLKKHNNFDLNLLADANMMMRRAQSENVNDLSNENISKKSSNYSIEKKRSADCNSIDKIEEIKLSPETKTNNLFFKVKKNSIDEQESINIKEQLKIIRIEQNKSINEKASATKTDPQNESGYSIKKIDKSSLNPSFMQNSSSFMEDVTNIPGLYTSNKNTAEINSIKENLVNPNTKIAGNISLEISLQEIEKLKKEMSSESELKGIYETKLNKEKEKNGDLKEKVKNLEQENKILHKKYQECNQYMILDEQTNRFITAEDWKKIQRTIQDLTANQSNNDDLEFLKNELESTKSILLQKEDSIKKISKDFSLQDNTCLESLKLLREFHPNFNTQETCGIPFFLEVVVGLQTKLKDLHNSNLLYMVEINELKSEMSNLKDKDRISTIKQGSKTQSNLVQKQRAWQDLGWSSIFNDQDPNTSKFIKQIQKEKQDLKDIVDYLLQNIDKFGDKFNKYYMNFSMEETLDELTKGLQLEINEMIGNVNLIRDSDKFQVISNYQNRYSSNN